MGDDGLIAGAPAGFTSAERGALVALPRTLSGEVQEGVRD